MSGNPIPDYAHTIVIPIANPTTAPTLLKLGATITLPGSGRLIALFVSLGDTESESALIDEIEPVIEDLQANGHAVELKVHISTSIARGILDIAREERADLLLLGLRQMEHGRVILGNIVDSVTATAPCDVLLYRTAKQSAFTKVMIPVDGSLRSSIACQVGILIGNAYPTPVEAIHIQESYRPQWVGRGRIEQSLADIPGREIVKRTVITAHDPASGLLSRVDENVLIVLGVSEKSSLERWLFGDLSGRVLRDAPGPVILVRRTLSGRGLARRLERVFSRFKLKLTQIEQEEILWQAQEMASPNLDYFVLLLLSAILASLGLLLNSSAVIIGAMLVAPLMQPLIGLALGITTGQIQLIWRSVATLLQGILLALVVSIGIGMLIPLALPTTEILARGNPSLLDAGVALASGMIGAYATARKDIPSALAGVAIAAALVPPLCTVGLNLGAGRLELSLYAGLLFLTNIVSISLAAWLVFFWLGIRPLPAEHRRRWITSLVLVLALALPVTVGLVSVSRQKQREASAARYIQEQFLSAEIVSLEVQRGKPARVIATLRAADEIDQSTVREAQDQLADILGDPVRLEIVVWKVIEPLSGNQGDTP
ncbi:MAG: TIGR00341 family protein [Anaerolineae bacterium]|nr:TIGR00341 family protein [Anaerolineae bacterium]